MKNYNICFSMPDLGVHLKELQINGNDNLIGVHIHDAVELVRVDIGEVACLVDKAMLILKAGDILILNKRVVHSLGFHERDSQITYIQIDIDRYEELLKHEIDLLNLKSRNLTHKLFEKGSNIDLVFEDIVCESKAERPHYENYIKADIFRIYAVMSRCGMISYSSELEELGKIKKIMPVIKYAEENIGEKISLEKAASLIGVNKFHLCKLFKSALGMTFIEYMNLLRLKKAKKLLLNTQKSISEIAYECGFESIQYFNMIFKKQLECTPKEFRKMNISIYSLS